MSSSKWKKPSLLLLADCVPTATGSPRQVEAWRDLQAATAGHTVSLACVTRGPVHLSHWRALRGLTARLEIQPLGGLELLRGIGLGHLAQRRMIGALRSVVGRWCRDEDFDAVYCGDSILWAAMPGDRVVRRVNRQALADVRLPLVVVSRSGSVPWRLSHAAPLAVAA